MICLSGLNRFTSPAEAMACTRQAFLEAHAFEGDRFVTVQSTGGDFALSCASPERVWSAGLAGLARTAAVEWPTRRAQAVDLETGDRPAALLADQLLEALEQHVDVNLGLLADGSRLSLGLQRAPRRMAASIVPGTVILATGGARGVTAACLLELARTARPRLVLLGRTRLEPESECCRGLTGDAALKSALIGEARARGEQLSPIQLGERAQRVLAIREVETNLSALAAAGAEVRYLSVDVSDRGALQGALATIRSEWGPIGGLIHGAGVLADRNICDKTPEQFDRVMAAKAGALVNLLDVLGSDPLKLLVLFSSVAAWSGNPGQCDYAAANEVLNKVARAEALHRPDCVVRSIGWGPWQGGMVTPAPQAQFAARGVEAISLEDGARHFLAELALGDDPEAVVGSLIGPAPAWPGVKVGLRWQPWLADHRLQGHSVVPLVLALEWFLQRTGELALDDLSVVKGVRLAADQSVDLRPGQGLELVSAAGCHYRARPGAGAVTPIVASGAFEPVSEPYLEKLFHGPAFRVILEAAVGAEGGTASLQAGRVPAAVGVVDPMLLDGGLQLARLWGYHLAGRPSLPTKIGRVRIHQVGLLQGLVRCALQAVSHNAYGTVSRLSFEDERGELVAELDGLEMYYGEA